jgi:hypothetical protein
MLVDHGPRRSRTSNPRLLVSVGLLILAIAALAVALSSRLGSETAIGTWGHGSWSWFGDPRAVYVAAPRKRVFVGWISWEGRVTIGAYTPGTGAQSTHVVGHAVADDHTSPSILVEPDKRLTVFWSAHNGPAMYYRTTLRPEDISAWGPLHSVPHDVKGDHGFTYPNPVLLPAEGDRLYLFWRGGNWSSDYSTRTPDGRWSKAHAVVGVPGQRPYMKIASNGSNEIALAFTNGHPRSVLTSIYYAVYRAGWLWTADGRRIERMGGRSIAPNEAQVVYDAKATHVRSWVWDVAFDHRDRPVIVYATFPKRSHSDYWYAAWTGKRWISHFLTTGGPSIAPHTLEGEYSGGIALDHSDPSIVYLSRQVTGGWEIERWQTSDGGASWDHTVVVPADGTQNVRPVVTRGLDHGPMSLLWLRGDYRYFLDYRTTVDFLR